MVAKDMTDTSNVPSREGGSGMGPTYAHCIIRDMTNSTMKVETANLWLHPKTSVESLFMQVCQTFKHENDAVDLILQDKNRLLSSSDMRNSLEDVGFLCEGNRNNVIITDKAPTCEPRALTAPASNEPPSPTVSSVSTSAEYNFPSSLAKKETGFVGLVNQAMTCYLNSLLQTLYMTPEFRNALYRWEFSGGDEEEVKSIPCQLQKLFLQLQTSKRMAVETTELTKSFGWDSSESWQQHDIQELCRVMFDALEIKLKNTKEADLLTRLYEGKMLDYVKCLECGTEKAREDTYLDIPLPVRPFGSATAYGSVEEALQAFVQPEILDGNNQYFCEKCAKKCDAHKGLKFKSFPYLLTIQLKRFDFDYQTLHRIKLNDRVTFPEVLDLSPFLSCGEDGGLMEETTVKNDDASTTDSGSALDEDACISSEGHPVSDAQEEDEGIDVSQLDCASHALSQLNMKSMYVYECFSIMIHSGSASGGHYYAYIKDFADRQWYCFNDQQVTTITQEDIERMYGGGLSRVYYGGGLSRTYSSAYSSSTNAYMLMYRQIDTTVNAQAMVQDNFPEHIKNLLQRMQEKEEEARLEQEKERCMCKISLTCFHPTSGRRIDRWMRLHKDTTLKEATKEALEYVGLQDTVCLERCRLVKYDPTSDTPEYSFENREEEKIGELIAPVRSSKTEMLLEIIEEGKQFQPYSPGGVSLKVYVVDLESDEVRDPQTLRAYRVWNVTDLKEEVADLTGLNLDTMQLALMNDSSAGFDKLLDPNMKLEALTKADKLFVESSSGGDGEYDFVNSQFYRILDRYQHMLKVTVFLPPTDKARSLEGSPVREGSPSHCAGEDVEMRTLSTKQNEELRSVASQIVGGITPARASPSPKPFPSDVEDEGSNPGSGVHSDQSASEDSSLTDSDRTLVGDPQDDGPLSNSADSLTTAAYSPKLELNDDYNIKSCLGYDEETKQRMVEVSIDKRMSVVALKRSLQPYVGVSIDNFKVYRQFSSSSDMELDCTNSDDNFMNHNSELKLKVRLGRALRKGESRGKLFLLKPNHEQPVTYLSECVISRGMTVQQLKRDLLAQLEKKDIHIPFNRCRLRRKSNKNPLRVYLNEQKFDEDMLLCRGAEMFLEELSGTDPVTSTDQVSLYARRWNPSQYTYDSLKEVVMLQDDSVQDLKQKLSEMSSIPVDNIEVAKGSGLFPCFHSVMTVHTDLHWVSQGSLLQSWPLSINDDGFVVFYRDRTEALKTLSEEERKQITVSESEKYGSKIGSSPPRRERPLKIYLDSPAVG